MFHHPHQPSDLEQKIQGGFAMPEGGTIALSHAAGQFCPILGLRLSLYRSGLVMEKYPWQTLAALLMIAASGQVCIYMGFTFLAAGLLYAATNDSL